MLIFVRNWLSLKCYIDIIDSVKKNDVYHIVYMYVYGIRDSLYKIHFTHWDLTQKPWEFRFAHIKKKTRISLKKSRKLFTFCKWREYPVERRHR